MFVHLNNILSTVCLQVTDLLFPFHLMQLLSQWLNNQKTHLFVFANCNLVNWYQIYYCSVVLKCRVHPANGRAKTEQWFWPVEKQKSANMVISVLLDWEGSVLISLQNMVIKRMDSIEMMVWEVSVDV